MSDIVPPEFVVYKPSITNGIKYVIEIIDPPSQGVYRSETLSNLHTKQEVSSCVERLMYTTYRELGLQYDPR